MATDLTALDLSARASNSDSGSDDYREVLDRLSGALKKAAIDGRQVQSDAFLAQIEEFRLRLAHPSTSAVFAAFPDVCDDYFSRARAYLLEREHEYADLIDVLNETVSRVTGGSDTFHAELRDTSVRMERLLEVDDIRQLKERIAKESSRLKEASDEQKRTEEKTLSRLTRRIETLEASLTEAQKQAATDPLTGLANRGYFDEAIRRRLEAFDRAGDPVVLALADIDHFKAINDTHGHPQGDRVIVCAAQWLQAAMRGTDVVARYGGEEFALILSHTTAAQASDRLTDVLQRLATRSFEYESSEGPRSVAITLSAGVAEAAPGDTVESLIRRADEGLYQAKQRGRNRVIVRKRTRLSALFG